MTIHIGVNGRTFDVEQPGGAVQAARRFTRELTRFDDVSVTLYGDASLAKEFDASVVSSRFPSSVPARLVWERTYLPYRAGKDGVDILFCPNGNGPLHDPGYPVAMFVYDVNAQIGMSGGFHGLYRKATVPRASRVSDLVLTISEFSKREIRDHLGVLTENISVVYLGVDELFLEEGGCDPVDVPDRYVLYVGAMNPRKNIGRLLQAARSLPEGVPLVMVGPENKAVFGSLEVDVPDDIEVLGYLSKRELKYVYSHADCFVFPSLYEGFGMPPLEAMACGTPVVAGDAAALPEVLGEAAEFVDPGSVDSIADGINRILSDDEYAATLTKRGIERVDNFSWQKSGDALMRTLRSIATCHK